MHFHGVCVSHDMVHIPFGGGAIRYELNVWVRKGRAGLPEMGCSKEAARLRRTRRDRNGTNYEMNVMCKAYITEHRCGYIDLG